MTPRVKHLVCGLSLLAVVTLAPLSAQEPKVRKRLPPYFKDVVTPVQRETIYALQLKYNTDIARLEAQIKDLTSKRDAEIEKVLTPEQKLRVKLARDAAARQRAAQAAPDPAAAPVR